MRTHKVRNETVRRRFLDALEEGKSFTAARKAAGLTTRELEAWKDQDADFAQDWRDAEQAGTDMLEDAAVRRGKRQSDALLMFMLKARRPEKYRENTPPPTANVVIKLDKDDSKL